MNAPGQRFCHGCGSALATGAAQPVTKPERPLPEERSPHAYTPKHLADKILTQRSALEGERKQVTVLFADVRGSMELAEQLGADEWHTVLDRFFEVLTEGVHRFEGTVNQYTGDGIMALFGAPIAHEDHAQRACFADIIRVSGHPRSRASRTTAPTRGAPAPPVRRAAPAHTGRRSKRRGSGRDLVRGSPLDRRGQLAQRSGR
jgi:class 3 adenylate cyclase